MVEDDLRLVYVGRVDQHADHDRKSCEHARQGEKALLKHAGLVVDTRNAFRRAGAQGDNLVLA